MGRAWIEWQKEGGHPEGCECLICQVGKGLTRSRKKNRKGGLMTAKAQGQGGSVGGLKRKMVEELEAGEGAEMVGNGVTVPYNGGGMGMVPPDGETYDPSRGMPGNGGGKKWSGAGQMVLTALIALGVSVVMLMMFAPTKSAYQADITRLEIDMVQLRNSMPDSGQIASSIAALESKVANEYAKLTDVPNVPADVTALEGRVGVVEGNVGALDERVGVLEEAAEENGNGSNTTGDGSGGDAVLSYYAIGSFGQYKLHVTSLNGGSFVAKVNLVYGEPKALVGASINDAMKAFHDGLTSPNRVYDCDLRWNGAEWEAIGVSFFTGGFTLEAGVEAVFNVGFVGLPEEYGEGLVSFVEVFPLVGTTPEGELDDEI